jgi:hypothetical protein
VTGRYAEDTSVPADRSRAEIERTLARYGATAFAYGWEGDRSIVRFKFDGRQYGLTITMPDRESLRRVPDKGRIGGYRDRTDTQLETAYDQACRQKWRALALVVKAKLEAVASEISTVEREFLADTLLEHGQTVGEWISPQLKAVYEDGGMPEMLPGLGTARKALPRASGER